MGRATEAQTKDKEAHG